MWRAISIVPYVGVLSIFLLTMRLGPADALVGYDCDIPMSNIETISLVDTNDCNYNIDPIESSIEDVALLQRDTYKHLEVLECKVEISQKVYMCGMPSSNATIRFDEYIHHMSREECKSAHNYGTIAIGNTLFDNLQVNTSTLRTVQLAGTIDTNGSCIGEDYSDAFGTWNNVIVSGNVKITLRSNLARVDALNNEIILPSGADCKLSEKQCMDSLGGYVFWDVIPRSNCSGTMYSKLFQGQAVQTKSVRGTVYSVNDNGRFSSLIVLGSESSCGVELLTTQYPELFIVKVEDLLHLESNNLVESRVDYGHQEFTILPLEKLKHSRVKSIYREVINHDCERKVKSRENALTLALTNPDEFALRHMGGLGYKAYLAGEVINIVQCIPVVVKARHVDKCYNHMPIFKGNDTVFLTARTHLISNDASEIPCDSPLLGQYKIDGQWYKFMPNQVAASAPRQLSVQSSYFGI